MLRIGRAAAVLAVLVAVAGCGGGDSPPVRPELEQALWPHPDDPATGTPVAVTRSFVERYIGMLNAALGEFRQREPGAGEVEVHRRGEDGRRLPSLAATVTLRKLDGEHWFVTSAHSPEVEVTAPKSPAKIASPVRIAGRGRGFEGNVVLEVRAAFATVPLAKVAVIAGSAKPLEPFDARLRFDAPALKVGAIVAQTGSGIEGGGGFAAFPVKFAG